MMTLKDFMAGRPPVASGSKILLFGVLLLVASLVGLKLTNQNYWWAIFAAAVVIASYGGIANSRVKGE